MRSRPASRRGRALGREESAVGGEGEVLEALEGGQLLDQAGEVAADEGFAPGDADLLDAVRDEEAREAHDLLVREDLLAVEELEGRPEHFLGHAVDAAEVAAVRHGDAQVAEGPVEGVAHWHQG